MTAISSRDGSLPALLHVRFHELLGIDFEHLVDFVQQIVEFGLDLLARLTRRRSLFDDLILLLRCWFLLLLSLCHGSTHTPHLRIPAARGARRLTNTRR